MIKQVTLNTIENQNKTKQNKTKQKEEILKQCFCV